MLALAVPVMADDVIYNGSDLWQTKGDGKTFADFSKEPIPAGFFCNKSEPFTGRIAFQGVPLRTAEGSLGATDTIIQRLDDAAFDNKGVATTRLQIRALLLESIAPVKTACGSYRVKVRLTGNQPVTRMRIVRQGEAGGFFVAPLAVNVRMSFTPVAGKAGERLEVTRKIRFNPARISWTNREENSKAIQQKGFLLVDTDGDNRSDTYLPGTSNFAAGWRAVQGKAIYDNQDIMYDEGWHEAPTHAHVTSGL